MVDHILKLMGKSHLEPVVLNRANNEIKHQYLSADKARKILGWESKYPLEEGLKETIEWYQNFLREENTCVISV
jgi:CDP-glucose 4,6-dehydratase